MKVFSITLIILGLVVYILYFMFRIMHWPGSDYFEYGGALMVVIGILLFQKNKKRHTSDNHQK